MLKMRSLKTLSVLSLFLLQTMLVAIPATSAEISARGGSNDDFRISGIALGNATLSPEVWIQSDGSEIEYIFMNDQIEVSIEVTRGGTSFTGKAAPVVLDVVHPIGYVIESFYWNTTDLIGGQSYSNSIYWSTDIAHSILNVSSNDLEGGLTLRASVNYASDDRNENDISEHTVPVAVTNDLMEQTQLGPMTFFNGRYPVNGGDATSQGAWRADNSNSAVGTQHWVPSNAGANYPSGAHDRLVRGFAQGSQDCGINGQLDPGLTVAYQIYICRDLFYANNYVSSQFHAQAYGTMGSGDSVAFEMWRGSGNYNDPMESVHWNITNGMVSPTTGEYTNISWDPQITWSANPNLGNPDLFLGGNTFSYGFLLHSDSSGATEGLHLDDFIQFGVSKVSEYTLDVTCDNPANGYSSPPNGLLALRCDIKNNGYSPATIVLRTNVSNDSWMAPVLQLRIEAAMNQNDNDNNVILQGLDGGETTEAYFNLSIPAGADVQQLVWNMWITDSSASQKEKFRVSMNVGVSQQYSVALQSSTGLLAATLEPSESGRVPFRLQNTGNIEATFLLSSIFSEDGWSSVIENETGAILQNSFTLGKGESISEFLNITAAEMANPGEVSMTVRATCPTCGGAIYGNDVLVRNIEVPIQRQVSIIAEEDSYTGPANGIGKTMYFTVLNEGNDDESYRLELTSNFLLGANLLSTETPVMDAWDGEAVVGVNFPMPVGLEPGIYVTTLKVINTEDSLVRVNQVITIEILDTAAVFVTDEDADQSYIPGDIAQSMEFEIRNDGNQPDRFAVTLDVPDGMEASITLGLFDGLTTEIQPGASTNVTVTFTFLEGASGSKTLGVIATSQADSSVSATGNAVYQVGSQNWLRIFPVSPIIINDADQDYEVTIQVANQYTTAQSVTMELDAGEASNYLQSRIDSSDRGFVLQVNEDKEVTIELEVSETTLLNLPSDQVVVNLTIWARSETVSDAAQQTIQVTLTKSVSEVTEEGDEEGFMQSSTFQSIIYILLSIVILGAGAMVILKILGKTEDDYIDEWADGYEDSVQATYSQVAAAPTFDEGGFKEAPAIPSQQPPSPESQAQAAPEAPAPSQAAPPVPAEGLPAGWSMEQWNAYGQMWLEQNGRA